MLLTSTDGTSFDLDDLKQILNIPIEGLQLERLLAQRALVLLPLLDACLAIHIHACCTFLGVIY